MADRSNLSSQVGEAKGHAQVSSILSHLSNALTLSFHVLWFMHTALIQLPLDHEDMVTWTVLLHVHDHFINKEDNIMCHYDDE